MPESVRDWLAPLLALIGGGGIAAMIQAWRKPSSRAEDANSEAAADHARTEGFVKLLDRLEVRLSHVEAEADKCQAENAAFRKDLAERDAMIEELTTRIKRLESQLEARDLRDAAQALPGTFATVENDRVTVMRPARKGKATQ